MKRFLTLFAAMLLALMPQGAMAQLTINWDTMPMLPYRDPPDVLPEMVSYVAGEYRAKRCPTPPLVAGHRTVRADVAVLLDDDGTVRATVPRAINCVTVEQYAAGIVAAAARNNLLARGIGAPGWYRASLTFDWAE